MTLEVVVCGKFDYVSDTTLRKGKLKGETLNAGNLNKEVVLVEGQQELKWKGKNICSKQLGEE